MIKALPISAAHWVLNILNTLKVKEIRFYMSVTVRRNWNNPQQLSLRFTLLQRWFTFEQKPNFSKLGWIKHWSNILMSILNRKNPNQTHQQFIVILPRSWKQYSYCINIVTGIFRHNLIEMLIVWKIMKFFYIHPYLIVSSISRSELKAKRKKKKKS